MKLSPESLANIEKTIKAVVNKLYNNCKQASIATDIHLQATQASGELTLLDDEDTELGTVNIKEWPTCEGSNFYEDTGRILTSLLNKMKSEGCFDKLNLLKPYSFVLVDEDKETVAELLLMDDDTLLLDEELLKGLDEELDAFLKDLLEK